MICPGCGAANPSENARCRQCNSLLRPMPGVATVSAGLVPPGSGSAADPTRITALTPSVVPVGPDGLFASRYRLVQELGRGAMGIVYRAEDTTLAEEVAIKFLHRQDGEESDLDRFKREIRTARQITHPNVVRIHDIGMVGNDAFISMELLTGGTLRPRIRAGDMPLAERIRIARGLCNGLAAAHRQGVIHRDIKPDNVMFSGDGEPKLCDFGLARWADSTIATQGYFGTPRYMSPEQAEGGEVNAKSDLYSLGVMLYELFTGQPPFNADNLFRLATLHSTAPPPPLRSIRSDIPATVERAVLHALAKAPDDRPENAEQLLAEMDGAAPPVRSAAGVTPTPARRALLFGGSFVVTLLLIVAARAGFVAMRPSATPTPARTPPEVAILATATAPPLATATAAPVATPAAVPTHRASVAVVPKAKPTVSVRGNPWVSVYVDGKQLTDAYPVIDLALDPGAHTLRFVHPGQIDQMLPVELKAGDKASFRVTKDGGRLVVRREG